MTRKSFLLAILMVVAVAAQALAAAQPGVTATVFNKKFLAKLKPMMPYSQLAAAAGAPGAKIAEVKGIAQYHWNGARQTALDAKVSAGKVVAATVTTPKQRKLSLGEKRGLFD